MDEKIGKGKDTDQNGLNRIGEKLTLLKHSENVTRLQHTTLDFTLFCIPYLIEAQR